MDFTKVLTEHFAVVVVVACLIVGYLLKHSFKKVPNCYIPVILTVLGAVLNVAVGGLSIENVVYGGLMGLASTGMHQAFTRFIEGKKEELHNQ